MRRELGPLPAAGSGDVRVSSKGALRCTSTLLRSGGRSQGEAGAARGRVVPDHFPSACVGEVPPARQRSVPGGGGGSK